MCAKCNRHRPLEERFWAKVNKDGPIPDYAPHLGPCWLWTGATTGGHGHDGRYGEFWFDKRVGYAHRFAYELLIGPIPEKHTIDHLCRVRHCVNPAHLEPVTNEENIRRGELWVMLGSHNRAKTHCPYGHPYDATNTYLHKKGRQCRICRRDRQRHINTLC